MGNRINLGVNLSDCKSILIQTRRFNPLKTSRAVEKLLEMGIECVTTITSVDGKIKKKIKEGEFQAILILTNKGKFVKHKSLWNLMPI